jgi:Flp pilus assembly pilin Flp
MPGSGPDSPMLEPKASASLPAGRGWRPRTAPAGQGLVEYSLILVIIAVVCVISLVFFGDQLSALLSLVASAV